MADTTAEHKCAMWVFVCVCAVDEVVDRLNATCAATGEYEFVIHTHDIVAVRQ